MHHSKTLDTIVGLFVATAMAALFFLAMQVSNLGSFMGEEGYIIKARFENSGGLKVRSPVSMAGVTVGRISAIYFDSETYESVVEMRIESQYDMLPDDTSASILTAGLLGEKYLGLEAGGSPDYLAEGSELDITQSALILEEIIGKFLFSKAEEGE